MLVVIGLFSPQLAFAADLGTKKGNAYINWSTGGLLGATRQVYFNTDGSQTNTDKTWEVNPSGTINVTYSTVTSGVSPPILPNNNGTDRFLVQIFYENETGTAVQTLYDNPSAPTSPTTWTFDTTSKSGTYRIFARIIGTSEAARTDYDVTSDGTGAVDWHKGALRVGMNVSAIAHSGYPAGAKYAYGIAGNESVTATITHTASRVVSNTEDVKIRIRRNSTQGEIDVSGGIDAETDGTTASSFVIDSSFAAALVSYDAEIEISGASVLLTTEKWTHIASVTAPIVSEGSGTIARKPTVFDADTTISLSSVSSGQTVYNRGEATTHQFQLLNARSENLTRSVGWNIRDSGNIIKASKTDTGSTYGDAASGDYTIGSTDDAVNTITGAQWNIITTLSDANNVSANIYNVSSLYFIDAHPELDSTLNQDDFPTEDANETYTGVIAADLFSFFAHVKNVRKDTNIDTSGSAVEFTVKKPDGTTSATQTSDTGSNGWTSNYDFSPVAPAGSWSVVASTTFNGNSGTDTETLTFVSPYSGNYQLEAVGWNQTYDIGDTARFTIRTLQRISGTFTATAADSAPTYELRYWDGATWQSLASGSMTALGATGTYEITYAIPNDSAWIGRKVAVSFSAVMSGTRINDTREIEIVGSPAQVVINSITDVTIPTISASTRITNEGTAAFEYTYEYCVVTVDTNPCGGGDDVAYGSAAKLIQAGVNFDTTLTLNVTQTGNYIFKVAVWWSNQSSKSSKTFTATSESTPTPTPTPSGGGGGGGGGGIVTPTPQPAEQNTFAAVWQKIAEILSRILGLENRTNNLEARVASLELQLGQRVSAPTPRQEIFVPKPKPSAPKVEAPAKPFFKIRLQ